MDEAGQINMSNVTNVIVSVWGGRRQRELLEPFTVPDSSRRWRGCLSSITEGDAGNVWVHDGKGPECHVWVGAFNHMNRQAFLADIENLPWRDPFGVQVLIRGQDDDCFGLWMFQQGRLREVSLPGFQRKGFSSETPALGETGMLVRIEAEKV